MPSTPLAQKREPSLRTCQRSSVARPVSSASRISFCGTCVSRSSGVKISSAVLTDALFLGPSQDPFRARIPAQYPPVRIERDNGEVHGAFDQQAQALIWRPRVASSPRRRCVMSRKVPTTAMIPPSVLRTGAALTEKTPDDFVHADDFDLFIADDLTCGQCARQRPFVGEIGLSDRCVYRSTRAGTARHHRAEWARAGCCRTGSRPCGWHTAIAPRPDRG